MIVVSPGLVPVRHPVEEHLAAVLPLHSIVDRVRVRVGEVGKQVVALEPLLPGGLAEEVREIVVERGDCPRPGVEREVVDPSQSTAVAEQGIGQTVGGGIDVEHAPVLADPFLPQYPLDEQPAAPGEEGVDVVVVADPRQCVALVGKTDAARGLRQVDRVAVPIGELEISPEHEFAIGTPLYANGRAELVAQSPLEVVRIDGHGTDSGDRGGLAIPHVASVMLAMPQAGRRLQPRRNQMSTTISIMSSAVDKLAITDEQPWA